MYTVFCTMSAVDFIIAGVMCFYLHKGRSMTTFSRLVLHPDVSVFSHLGAKLFTQHYQDNSETNADRCDFWAVDEVWFLYSIHYYVS